MTDIKLDPEIVVPFKDRLRVEGEVLRSIARDSLGHTAMIPEETITRWMEIILSLGQMPFDDLYPSVLDIEAPLEEFAADYEEARQSTVTRLHEIADYVQGLVGGIADTMSNFEVTDDVNDADLESTDAFNLSANGYGQGDLNPPIRQERVGG
ncbi:hypothetical protein STSO111631_18020 [Stackebrandtia soli]